MTSTHEGMRVGGLVGSAIWPLGHGSVMVSCADVQDALVLRARPDGTDHLTPAQSWAASIQSGGPVCIISFANVEAIDGLIVCLRDLRKAARARAAEPSQGDGR